MAAMVDSGRVVGRAVEAALAPDAILEIRELALTLLANVTTTEEGARAAMQLGDGVLEGLHVQKLAQRFLARPSAAATTGSGGGGDGGGNGAGPAAAFTTSEACGTHVASLLVNITGVLPEGRALVKRRGLGLLPALLGELGSATDAPGRRRGAAGCLRNCCLDLDDHPWLVDEALTSLLRPLTSASDRYTFEEKVSMDPALWRSSSGGSGGGGGGRSGSSSGSGASAAERPREPDTEVRACLLEALLCLATAPESRRRLRQRGVAAVVRETRRWPDDTPGGRIAKAAAALAGLLDAADVIPDAAAAAAAAAAAVTASHSAFGGIPAAAAEALPPLHNE
ncbi:unnamed protein product [Phaeothamnion confervicola]